MRIRELSLNPAKAFSSGFDKASDTVDKAFTPSQWGKGSTTVEPNRSKPNKSSSNIHSIEIEKYQKRDAEEIMQAVVNGDVSLLSSQQQQLADKLLRKLQQL